MPSESLAKESEAMIRPAKMPLSMMKGKEGTGGQQEEEGGKGQRQEEEEACLYRWNSTKGLFPEPAFSLAIQKQGLLLCAGSPGDLWFLIFTVLCANPQSQICKQATSTADT